MAFKTFIWLFLAKSKPSCSLPPPTLEVSANPVAASFCVRSYKDWLFFVCAVSIRAEAKNIGKWEIRDTASSCSFGEAWQISQSIDFMSLEIVLTTFKSVFCVGVIIHFAFLKRPSKPESTPFFSVPAIGWDPINRGCKFSHVFTIDSLTEPTSVSIVSLGIDDTNCWDGLI